MCGGMGYFVRENETGRMSAGGLMWVVDIKEAALPF